MVNKFLKKAGFGRLNDGLTLIEMIVVIAIFAIVSSVLLFNYSSFRGNVSLRNLSQEVAIAVRKAQTYATSVHGINIDSTTRDYPAFGMAFATGSGAPVTTPDEKQFMLFADIPPNGSTLGNSIYDHSSLNCGAVTLGDECVESFQISSSDKISNISVCTISNCSNVAALNILFHRPNPDALFCVPVGSACDGNTYSSAVVTLQSADGSRTRSISVWNTGQISVQ